MKAGALAFLTTCATLTLVAPSSAAAQSGEDVATLLSYSGAESVLDGYEGMVRGVLDQILTGGLPPAASQVLARHMSLEALLPIMERDLASRGTPQEVARASALVSSGPIARVDSILDATGPVPSLEDYVAGLGDSPPSRERVERAGSMAVVQAAGEFFILVAERAREAAHLVARAVDPAAAPFEPMPAQEWELHARQSTAGAAVSFLYRYREVPDDVFDDALEAWTSETGQWYVQAYALALGEAVLTAAREAAAELTNSPGTEEGPGL